LIFEK